MKPTSAWLCTAHNAPYITNMTTLVSANRNINIGNKHPPIAAPNLRCLPLRVVGIPVFRAILRFARVIPVACLHEKDKPGMPVFVPFFLRLAIARHPI